MEQGDFGALYRAMLQRCVPDPERSELLLRELTEQLFRRGPPRTGGNSTGTPV